MVDAVANNDSSRRRLTEIHAVAARERAMRIFCTSSTIFPQEWATNLVSEQTMIDLSEFSYHARRLIDLCELRNQKFMNVNQFRFGLSPDQDIIFIADFHEAINRLHHVRKLEFDWAAWHGEKIFLASPTNFVPSFVRVATDKRATANISLFGIAFSFLSSVIPTMISKFPEYRF